MRPALLALLTLLALAGTAGPARAEPPLRAHAPGEEVIVARCLRVAVLDFTDRNGPLEPEDWVTLRVHNGCREPVRHLLLDLLLVDVLGRVYGARLWVLDGGEVLPPGRSKTEHYPVPDDADHVPRQWTVLLRSVERPSDRGRPYQPAYGALRAPSGPGTRALASP